MIIREVNFDGLVGPTHHFGGLGVGNLASIHHHGDEANPRMAAMQGLDKIRLMHSLGCPQAILPPHPRPQLTLLRSNGFRGSDQEMVQAASDEAPWLLSACYSASSMWAANAATVTRTSGLNRCTHLTPANLVSSVHRSIEAPLTTRLLREILTDESKFCIHDPLPTAYAFRDEGAANHMRLSDASGQWSLDVFVYGETDTIRFPSRQAAAASEAIARRHELSKESVFFLRQHPHAIDAGAFHNDVVATSHCNVLLHHEFAFEDAGANLAAIEAKFADETNVRLVRIEVPSRDLSLDESVACYLFNSQIVGAANEDPQSMTLVCPIQCQQSDRARHVVERILADENPIHDARFVDLRESMNNGGGPACLRLRIPMDTEQLAAVRKSILWTDGLEEQLRDWVVRFYPERLCVGDLTDPDLIHQCREANKSLARILDLESLLSVDSSASIGVF